MHRAHWMQTGGGDAASKEKTMHGQHLACASCAAHLQDAIASQGLSSQHGEAIWLAFITCRRRSMLSDSMEDPAAAFQLLLAVLCILSSQQGRTGIPPPSCVQQLAAKNGIADAAAFVADVVPNAKTVLAAAFTEAGQGYNSSAQLPVLVPNGMPSAAGGNKGCISESQAQAIRQRLHKAYAAALSQDGGTDERSVWVQVQQAQAASRHMPQAGAPQGAPHRTPADILGPEMHILGQGLAAVAEESFLEEEEEDGDMQECNRMGAPDAKGAPSGARMGPPGTPGTQNQQLDGGVSAYLSPPSAMAGMQLSTPPGLGVSAFVTSPVGATALAVAAAGAAPHTAANRGSAQLTPAAWLQTLSDKHNMDKAVSCIAQLYEGAPGLTDGAWGAHRAQVAQVAQEVLPTSSACALLSAAAGRAQGKATEVTAVFCRVLAAMLCHEQHASGPQAVAALCNNRAFMGALLAISLDFVAGVYHQSNVQFPHVLSLTSITALDYYKMAEQVARFCPEMPWALAQQLLRAMEMCLEALLWTADSPLVQQWQAYAAVQTTNTTVSVQHTASEHHALQGDCNSENRPLTPAKRSSSDVQQKHTNTQQTEAHQGNDTHSTGNHLEGHSDNTSSTRVGLQEAAVDVTDAKKEPAGANMPGNADKQATRKGLADLFEGSEDQGAAAKRIKRSHTSAFAPFNKSHDQTATDITMPSASTTLEQHTPTSPAQPLSTSPTTHTPPAGPSGPSGAPAATSATQTPAQNPNPLSPNPQKPLSPATQRFLERVRQQMLHLASVRLSAVTLESGPLGDPQAQRDILEGSLKLLGSLWNGHVQLLCNRHLDSLLLTTVAVTAQALGHKAVTLDILMQHYRRRQMASLPKRVAGKQNPTEGQARVKCVLDDVPLDQADGKITASGSLLLYYQHVFLPAVQPYLAHLATPAKRVQAAKQPSPSISQRSHLPAATPTFSQVPQGPSQGPSGARGALYGPCKGAQDPHTPAQPDLHAQGPAGAPAGAVVLLQSGTSQRNSSPGRLAKENAPVKEAKAVPTSPVPGAVRVSRNVFISPLPVARRLCLSNQDKPSPQCSAIGAEPSQTAPKSPKPLFSLLSPKSLAQRTGFGVSGLGIPAPHFAAQPQQTEPAPRGSEGSSPSGIRNQMQGSTGALRGPKGLAIDALRAKSATPQGALAVPHSTICLDETNEGPSGALRKGPATQGPLRTGPRGIAVHDVMHGGGVVAKEGGEVADAMDVDVPYGMLLLSAAADLMESTGDA